MTSEAGTGECGSYTAFKDSVELRGTASDTIVIKVIDMSAVGMLVSLFICRVVEFFRFDCGLWVCFGCGVRLCRLWVWAETFFWLLH